MAVVRARREVGAAPLPGARLTAAETPESRGAQLYSAKAQTAERIGAIFARSAEVSGQVLGEVIELRHREQQEDNLLSRDRQFAEFEQQLRDPERGAFATTKGAAAKDLLPKITGDFDQLSAKLEQGLSKEEKRAFYRLRDRR